MSELSPRESEFLLYTSDNGDVKLNVLVLDETVWLTQEGMQELFGRAKSTISEHISNVFSEGELDENSTVRKFRIVQTAAEIIFKNADSKKENMGLSTWKNAPDGRILKTDAQIAKNYLEEKEIKKLERTVSGFFDYIENIIENRATFTMEAFAESVNKFLSFNEYKILEGKGSISVERAKLKAGKEYDKFNKTQRIVSDFDKEIKKITGKNQ